LPREEPGVPPSGLRAVRDVPVVLRPPEDDEPTKPNAARRSLTVSDLTRVEAGQLAGIIAAWESSDHGDRQLLAEFAARLAIPRRK